MNRVLKAAPMVMAVLCLLAGCGVFRNSTSDRQLDKVDTRVSLDISRVDTSKRLVWERVSVRPPLPGQSYAFSGKMVDGQLRLQNELFSLHLGFDSLGNVLSGTFDLQPLPGGGEAERLTIEQKGESETDNSEGRFKAKSEAEASTEEASWKGVWVWLGGIALVLVFLYILVRYFFKR